MAASNGIQARRAPNVVIVLADDLGFGDVACLNPDSRIPTPSCDALARQGMLFVDAHSGSAVCTPTRYGLLTGRYAWRSRLTRGVLWGYSAPLIDPHVVTLPQLLQREGYRTAAIGKWHLGLEERGFESFDGFLGDMMDDYYHHRRHGIGYLRRNAVAVEAQGHATDVFTAWACERLTELSKSERPFFLQLAYNAPHTPIQPPSDVLTNVLQREPGITEPRAKLVALIEHLDSGIGQVMETLKSLGLEDSTIVVFTSDNGGQLDAGANNGRWRDGKQSRYEGGIRVPCCLRWPGVTTEGSHCQFPAVTMDLVPTLCHAVGITVPRDIDGQDLGPALRGRENELKPRPLFFHRREGGPRYGGLTIQAVIEGRWKLVQNSPFAPRELFDLETDPLESQDVSSMHPQVVKELAAKLARQTQRGGEVPWQKPATVSDGDAPAVR